eukprot:1722406-Amphidinium_carterae.2
MVHKLSSIPSDGAEGGRMKKWLHTSLPTIQKMLETGNLGSRLAYHHYQLSNAKLGPQTILLCAELNEDFFIDEGVSALNGYCHSISIKNLPIQEAGVKFLGAVHLSESLATELASTQGLQLTTTPAPPSRESQTQLLKQQP